jgi:hypothetical protein
MPRKPAPIPPITPVPKTLTVEDAAMIIEIARRAAARRVEFRDQMRDALAAGNDQQVIELARQFVQEDIH